VAWEKVAATFGSRLTSLLSPASIRAARGYISQQLANANERISRRQINNWQRFVTDFIAHAARFAEKAEWDRSRPFVKKLTFGLSEPHRGGRTVLRVELADSTKWFYKPRSGRHEQVWAKLVNELNAAGFSPPLLALSVVAGHTHCWMPALAPEPCRSWQEVERFYFRAGALLYLAHLLRAVDLHAGNFIAHREHPVLIDCETILHPNVSLPATAPDQKESILRTGMLPVASEHSQQDCASFLGRMTTGHHAVLLLDRRIRVTEMGRQFARGFKAMDHFLATAGHRSRLDKVVAKMRAVPVRIIYRPTRFYVKLLSESLSPEFAGSEAARRWFLRTRLEDRLCPTAVVDLEIEQLIQCDIPLFHGRAAAPRPLLSRSQMRRALAGLRASCHA